MKTQTKSPALSKASALLLLSALPSFASALYIQVSPAELFGRQDSTCGDSSYTQCSQAGLPDDFCCPADQVCIALAGQTTALCCPDANDCNAIKPIPCDISLQDKTLHPENVVMTNALTGTLPKCNGLCCPFGYSCDGTNCVINQDQNAKPFTTGAQSSTATAPSTAKSSETVGVTTASQQSASATASATSSGSSEASATGTESESSSSTASSAAAASESGSSSSSNGPSAGLVAGGVVGGIAAAVFLGMLVWFFIKREAKRKNEAKTELPRSSRSSSFGNIINNPMTNSLREGCPVISKPIVDEGAMRSDFGRKVSPQAGSFQDAEDDYEKEFGMSGDRPVSEVDMSGLHSVPHSPPRITTPRAVSSMYAVHDYMDPHNSAYQAPLKMPSARQFGGQDNRVSVGAEGRDALGSPISDYGGQRVTRDPNGAYIDVFADSNVPLTPPQTYAGDRMTSFTDIMDESQGRRR
ncbi:hypothetical protein J7T55_008322 [Diaporthe amygdali]|uniref:uncharacterized protein n=1 Tax=Phomopsis amygdali TaxID=1214568 RepID=UPI0022FE2BFB|nr:uncharacterized protein J7T55_008322 [Diaporthe amygdali]KAJ0121160.1 hypothetical protein J7T55_008322 [Diaporthe amygdali]